MSGPPPAPLRLRLGLLDDRPPPLPQHEIAKARVSPGSQNKKAPEGAFVIFPLRREDIGAGEGIRTLDPNLGKVMLYP